MNTRVKYKISVVVVTRNRVDELYECLDSIFYQTHLPYEVIVIDNFSDSNLNLQVLKKYPTVKLIRSYINLGGAGGRNLGFVNSSGDYILFMDDDATADKDLIKELLKGFGKNQKVGIVQPKIYSKENRNKIQGIGHGINLKTGRVYGIGVGEEDGGQYDKDRQVPMVGCTWMVKREVFEKIGLYDDDLFIPYEDSDFCLRAEKKDFKIYYIYKAKVWHRGPKKTGVPAKLQWIGITTPERAFRVSRNKIIFMKKHATKIDLFIFGVLLMPMYSIGHCVIIIAGKRFDILLDYWKGFLSGYIYLLFK